MGKSRLDAISIVLIDDHNLFRSGLRALLSRQEGLSVIGEAADGISGVKLIGQLKPDVVLLDLDMSVVSGREALTEIIRSNPSQKVIMLTVSESAENLTECMRLGARGFLLKNIEAEFLVSSIRNVYAGDNVLSPEMTACLIQSLVQPQHTESAYLLSQLTPREIEVLGYLAAGHSNKLIARYLDLAESTIKVHVQNILRKLNLSSRVQAAIFAVQHQVEQPQIV